MEEILKVAPDKEKAKSILKMADLRLEMIKEIKDEKFASPLIEEYYEIIKELATAVMTVDGFKTTSHIRLIEYIQQNYSDFPAHEIYFLDQLRKLRNRIAYDGYFVKEDYLKRHCQDIQNIIKKLKVILENKL